MTSFRTLKEALSLGDEALVSFVGAGGKTSLMSRLAYELYEDRRKLAVTTTTHMNFSEIQDYWNASMIREGEGEEAIDEILGRAVMVSRVPFLYTEAATEEKLKGISTDLAESLYGKIDFLLVEADGGRQAAFKIPRPYEPVLPPSTTHLCIVMSGEVFEDAVSDDLIFNLEDIDKVMTIRRGEVCPPRLLRKLLLRADGYLRHATPPRKTFLLINKVDSADRVEAFIPRAGELFHPAFEGIILTSFEAGVPVVSVNNARDRIAAVILAAGESSRFGAAGDQKLCVDYDGEPMIRRVVLSAMEAEVERLVVVTGHEAEKVKACLDILPAHMDMMVIENRNFTGGVGSSLAAGVTAVSSWADAVMVLLGDMPAVDGDLMNRVIRAYKRSNGRLCYPERRGRRGHPVIFRKDFFPELMKLEGDRGGRDIVKAHVEWARVVRLDEGDGSQLDIDTEADMGKVRS
jgi:molybdenum cofactor cytidylyltransferase